MNKDFYENFNKKYRKATIAVITLGLVVACVLFGQYLLAAAMTIVWFIFDGYQILFKRSAFVNKHNRDKKPVEEPQQEPSFENNTSQEDMIR